jgi:hypothetical protein
MVSWSHGLLDTQESLVQLDEEGTPEALIGYDLDSGPRIGGESLQKGNWLCEGWSLLRLRPLPIYAIPNSLVAQASVFPSI